MQTGEISEARLNASVRRILTAKLRQQRGPAAPDLTTVGSPANQAVALESSRAAITAVKGRENLGVAVASKRVLVLSPVNLPAAGNGSQLAAELRQRGAQVTDVTYDFDSEASKSSALSRAPGLASAADLVVIGTWDAGPWQAQLVGVARQSGKPVYLLGFGMPYELALFPNAPTYLATYGRTPNQISAAVAALAGEFAPTGKLPVTIAGVASSAPYGP